MFLVNKSMRMYKRAVKLLSEKCPPPRLPVKVRRVRLKRGIDGDCEKCVGHYYIRINRNLSESEAIDTLIHEWAHALSWSIRGDDHCDEWGKAYSRVYRVFLKDCLEPIIAENAKRKKKGFQCTNDSLIKLDE